MTLATTLQQRHNAHVPFNSGSEFGDSNSKADSRLAAIFTSVRNTIGAPFFYGGPWWGYLRVCRFLTAGSPTPPRACHPRLATGSEHNAQ